MPANGYSGELIPAPQLFRRDSVFLVHSILVGHAPHRPSLAGGTCPNPFGQTTKIHVHCGAVTSERNDGANPELYTHSALMRNV